MKWERKEIYSEHSPLLPRLERLEDFYAPACMDRIWDLDGPQKDLDRIAGKALKRDPVEAVEDFAPDPTADMVSAFDDLHPRNRYQYQEIETVRFPARFSGGEGG